jgi:hypothetical protein
VSSIDILDECLGADICIDRFLWALYQRTPKEDTIKVRELRKVTVKKESKTVTVTKSFTKLVDEDFTWKDPKAAEKAGMPMMDYARKQPGLELGAAPQHRPAFPSERDQAHVAGRFLGHDMTTRWRKLQFISFTQKVLRGCNAPSQAAKHQLEHNVGRADEDLSGPARPGR